MNLLLFVLDDVIIQERSILLNAFSSYMFSVFKLDHKYSRYAYYFSGLA